MLKIVMGIVAGLIAGVGIVMLVQRIGHAVYPPPPGLDPANLEQMKEVVAQLPVGAFLFVIASYVGGTLGGGWLAAAIAGQRRRLVAGVIAAFILLSALATMTMIPHPIWFMVTSVLAIAVAGWFAGSISRK